MAGPSRNYSKELEKLLQGLQQKGSVPRLLLHACCAPCSSAVLEYLSQYFLITLLYYNPNIAPYEEYEKREAELRRLVSQMHFAHPVELLPCSYNGQAFVEAARGLEGEPEGGPSDFKKKDGYKRSIELSKEYSLYRQDYCGCAFSRAQRQREKERKDQLASVS